MDVFGWDESARRPTVAHPGECRFCLICEFNCPEVALDVGLPLHLMFDFGISPTKK
jgi:NAD-dependent dihydropyrimidine dehydrogenase PreA subunit